MNSPNLSWLLIIRAGVFIGLLCACKTNVYAQTMSDNSVAFSRAVPVQTQPAINFTVLKSQRASAGNHAVVFNRVAPPVLAARSAAVVTDPSPLSAEAIQIMERRIKKKFELLILSATVYDHEVTELRCFASGHDFRAYSNIDFNWFCGTSEVETDDTVYELIFGVGNQTRQSVDAMNLYATGKGLPEKFQRQIPPLSQFSGTRAEYVLEDTPKELPPEEALKGLDALHVYYDTNRQQLAENYARYQKEQAAHDAQVKFAKEHPTAVPDTVVNFWPGEGTKVIEAQGTGGKQ